MSSNKQPKTIRLIMPQWQGGDYDMTPVPAEIYSMGARLLSFLAPKSDAQTIEVPITHYQGEKRTTQNGVVWQDTVLQQFKTAREIIEKQQPDRIITFGGDCLVSQAPFAYLNERYQGNVGILWIDAHPDISTPQIFDREHAMVLGNLLGAGDPALSNEIKKPFTKEQVLIFGVESFNSTEEEQIVDKLGLKVIPTSKYEYVTQWIKENQFDHLVIHIDLDALDPNYFYSQLTKNPDSEPFNTVTGKLTIARLTRIITHASTITDVVGISFTEHMPWDALNLKNMMGSFSFMK